MKYEGFYILKSDEDGILSKMYGYDDYIKGAYFQVYADESCEIEVGSFGGIYGVNMRNNDESIEEFVKDRIDKNIKGYKKNKIYALIDKEYNEFLADVYISGDISNVLDTVDKISKMKLLHEYITIHKPLDSVEIDYFLTITNPLNTICDTFKFSLTRYGKTIEDTLNRIVDENIGECIKNDLYEDEEIEM